MLFNYDIRDAVPNRHFNVAPFRAELFSTNKRTGATSAGVISAQGINCLKFKSRPGAVLTNFETAKKIADIWNKEGTQCNP